MTTLGKMAVVLVGLAPLLAGCATKDWVRKVTEERVSPVEGTLAEQRQRVENLEGRLGAEGQRIATLEGKVAEGGQRVQALEQTVTSTAESVRDARARADAAMSRADAAFNRAEEVDQRLTRLWTNRHARKVAETLDIYFGFDKAELDDRAQTTLAGLVKELKSNPRTAVELQGYADPKGSLGYNVALSQRRVEAVRRYLVQQGIELPRIHAIGLGPIFDKDVENPKKRRVTVRLMVEAD
jgi:outer membrane protein OmpA-like peptidoglycan-associated protein